MSKKGTLAFLSDNFRDILQRPLAIFTIAFYIFCAVLVRTPSVDYNIILPVTTALAAVLFISFLRFRRAVRAVFALCLALCVASVFSFVSYEVRRNEIDSLAGEHPIVAEVTDVKISQVYGMSYVARADVMGEDVNIKFHSDFRLLEGEVFKCYANLLPLGDDALSRRAEGVQLDAQICSEIELIGMADRGVLGVFSDINHSLSSLFYARLGRDSGGFAASVLLGCRDNLPDPLYHALKGMGISHLIALSGLHLSIICSIAELFTSRFGRKASRVVAIPIAVFYMLLTDFLPSIVRSGVMLIVLSLIRLSKFRGDGITAVGVTLMGVTLLSPYASCDMGFQLSAAATLGVYAALRFMNDRRIWEDEESESKRRMKTVLTPFVIGAFATLFTLPSLIVIYDSVTFVGIIMTVPFSLFLTLIMWLLPLVLVLPFELYHALVDALINLFEGAALYFASVSSGGLIIRDKAVSFAVVSLLLILTALFLSAEKGRLRVGLCIAALSAFIVFIGVNWCADINRHTADILPLATDRGDILVMRSAGEILVCDMTDGGGDSIETALVAAHSFGATEIDVLILCDPTPGHFEMLYSDGALYGLERIYIAGEDIDYDYIDRLSEHVLIYPIRNDGTVAFGESSFTWLGEGEMNFEVAFADKVLGYSEKVQEFPEVDMLWIGSGAIDEGEVLWAPAMYDAVIKPWEDLVISDSPVLPLGELIELTK